MNEFHSPDSGARPLRLGDEPGREQACEEHGRYLSYRLFADTWSKCPACTQARAEADEASRHTAAREARLRDWLRQVGGSGIPERFRDRSLENFVVRTPEQRAAVAFAQDYVASFGDARKRGRGALFVGQPGTGKTHLAAAIATRLLAAKYTVLMTTATRAVRRVKDAWGPNAQVLESQAVANLTGADLLILDEVGTHANGEFERGLLFDVIDERYGARRPTILVSNLPVAEVRSYLGERVIDRLREDGGESVIFDWPSDRGRLPCAGA